MSTQTVKISDAAIKRALKDSAVSQLKDLRYSLYLKINAARDGGSWVLVRYRNGRQQKQTLGKWPAISSDAVFARLPALLLDDEGEAAVASYALCGELLGWYRDRCEGLRDLSSSRKASIRTAVDKHLLPRLNEVAVDDIDRELIDLRLIQPLQAGYALSYVKQILDVLKAAFEQAARLRLITANPLAGVRLGDFISQPIEAKPGKVKPMQIPDMLRFWCGFEGADLDALMLCLLMLLHGTRIGETRQAKWAHFDLEGGWWFIPEDKVKTRAEHWLPLTETVRRLLADYRQWQISRGYFGKYLFAVPGRRRWVTASATRANDWVQLISQREWTAHDLRKLARTCWADIGVDYMVGEVLLNHAFSNLDKAYIHTHMREQCSTALNDYHEWLLRQGLQPVLDGFKQESFCDVV